MYGTSANESRVTCRSSKASQLRRQHAVIGDIVEPGGKELSRRVQLHMSVARKADVLLHEQSSIAILSRCARRHFAICTVLR